MQKLIETLKEFGIEVPADKLSEVKKAISEHYKNVAEHNKALSKLEGERDSWKEKAETAEETLKKFEGIEPENIKRELEDWKKKAEEAEENAKQQIYERDFSDALKTEMESYKFTSEAAKKAIMAEINEAGLKLKDGRILGLTDLMEQIKEKDGSAFADEKQQLLENNKARFTQTMSSKGGGGRFSMSDLMKMANEGVDVSQYMK